MTTTMTKWKVLHGIDVDPYREGTVAERHTLQTIQRDWTKSTTFERFAPLITITQLGLPASQ